MTPAITKPDRRDQREFEHSLVEAILEASPDGILVVDDNATIMLHNQRLFEVFGISPGELPGAHDDVLSGSADQPLLARARADQES